MSTLSLLLLVGGLALLIVGGELLVRGASRLATAWGISPLVVGLTVVAFGTSAPEAAVAVQAAGTGQADIALGNVIGSNIFNILLILGLSATIAPLVVAQRLVQIEVPIMVGVSGLVLVLALDGAIGRIDGVVLLTGIVTYTVFAIRESRHADAAADVEGAGESDAHATGAHAWLVNLLLIVLGLGLLVIGARWLVDGAVAIAQSLGVSDLVIGLTIVAAGTSLPEVAASVIASLRGQRDIAAGNVVGSNLFNLLLVLGLTGLIAPDGVAVGSAVLGFDLPIMLAVAVACLPIFFTGHRIDRLEGLLFLAYYGAYSGFLLLQAAEHDALPVFSGVMLQFVVPLTLITLLVLFVHAIRERAGP